MKKKQYVIIIISVILVGVLVGNRKLIQIIYHNFAAPDILLDNTLTWEGGESFEKIQYALISPSDYLHLYVPESDVPMPLLILVHGGGFISNDCESRQAQLMYRYFRDKGYACATINYRLSTEAPYPGAIEDVKAAVRFLRANALKYGYDAEKFAIWGESAGGYLATMAAVTGEEEFAGVSFIGEESLPEQVSAEVSVLLNYYGIIDFELSEQDYRAKGIPKWVRQIANIPLNRNLEGYDSVEALWLRKSVNQCTAQELQQMNARYYIQKYAHKNKNLDVLIHHGDADLSVADTQSKRLAETFRALGGNEVVTYELFAGYKHADDRFYEENNLRQVKNYLDHCFTKK